MSAIADDDLHAQLAALRAENEQLRARDTVTDDAVAPPARKSGRWRTVLSAICIVVATILVPVSIVGAWARVQLVEEDAFVDTLAPLVDDPAVQAMIIDETMSGITTQVDFSQLTASVFDGIADLGLPPRAVQALRPAAGARRRRAREPRQPDRDPGRRIRGVRRRVGHRHPRRSSCARRPRRPPTAAVWSSRPTRASASNSAPWSTASRRTSPSEDSESRSSFRRSTRS